MPGKLSLSHFFSFSLILHAFVLFYYVKTPAIKVPAYEPVLALKLSQYLLPAITEEAKEKVMPVEKVLPQEKERPIPPEKVEKIETSTASLNKQKAPMIDSVARTNYENILAAWLQRYKTYPSRALRRKITGEGLLYVKINQNGQLLNYSLKKSTSHEILDQAIISMLSRAAPLPKIPEDLGVNEFDFMVPVSFEIVR